MEMISRVTVRSNSVEWGGTMHATHTLKNPTATTKTTKLIFIYFFSRKLLLLVEEQQ
jgi:hypothetical protein